eukprot:TRINITY_DN631_c0_g1_i1.p1 TRINITY_DN631_c0_g1~~TRINITY_DN631_c0_g1_i1.p1  ORF type:complete len:239 (+),score=83.99 TRINITY_DN631_c0_g1_i1:36-719(+)
MALKAKNIYQNLTFIQNQTKSNYSIIKSINPIIKSINSLNTNNHNYLFVSKLKKNNNHIKNIINYQLYNINYYSNSNSNSSSNSNSNSSSISNSNKLKIGDFGELTKTFSSKDIELFASLSEDNNPIHLDDEFAKSTKFGKRIVHGMLTSSLIGAVLGTKLPGQGSIYISQNLEFKSPVYLNEQIIAKIEVIEINKRIVTFNTTCRKIDGTIVIDGIAKVLVPQQYL